MPSYLDKAKPVEADVPSYMTKAQPVSGKGGSSDVKGGIVGDVLTGNTQRFGKTIGESLAAPSNADLYSESLAGHTKIQNDLIKTIQAKKKLGQDTSRLEHALQDHITSTPKLEDFTGDVVNKSTEQVLGEAAGTALEATTGGLLKTGAGAMVSKELPFLSKLKTGAKIGAAYGAIGAGTNALQEDKSAADVLASSAKGGLVGGILGGGLELAGAGIAKGVRAAPGLTESLTKPSSIMNRVARLTPSDAREFARLSGGESHGEYLTRTKNFGNPEKVVENEFDKFLASRGEADKAFESLPGKWQSKPLDTVLADLLEREGRLGVPSSDTVLIDSLVAKNKAGGLTNAEINQAKRIYERTIKTDFIKTNAAEGVERATRLDNSLRNWQMDLADSLGYKNPREINKQTQISRFIVDKLGKQTVGKTGLDAVSLTDWLMLSGASPTNLMGFFAKKFAGSKANMAKVADFLSKKVPKDEFIKADLGPSKIPLLEAPKPGSPREQIFTPIHLRGASSMEAPAGKINRSYDKGEQLMLPAPKGRTMTSPQGEVSRNLPPDLKNRKTIELPAPKRESSVKSATAKKNPVSVNPKTGKFQTTYSSESATPAKQKQPQPQQKGSKTYRSIVPKRKGTVNKSKPLPIKLKKKK